MSPPEKRKNQRSHIIHKTPGRWRVFVVLMAAILGGFLLGQAAVAGTSAVPGSQDDPLVTASWVESKLRELSRVSNGASIDLSDYEQRLDELEKKVEALGTRVEPAPPSRFEVVQVTENQTVFTGHGTEVVVRAGSVRVVEGTGGGFSDLTAGESLLSGTGVKLNHLLLSARKDGRGLAARSDALLLIRGDFEIK